MGRSKRSYVPDVRKTDIRKRENRNERRQVKSILNEGKFEGLNKAKKNQEFSADLED